jgi:hypothetical protein
MCDVYSFGIIMWELYSGQRPYLELLQSTKDKRARDKLILSKASMICRIKKARIRGLGISLSCQRQV